AVSGIVSLSPAATDLVLALGLESRLAGVSTFDTHSSVKGRLPVVGDYQRIDWERLGAIKPSYLIVQGRPDRLPPGLADRCAKANIQLINIQIDRLADIQRTIDQLGETLHVRDDATRVNEQFTQSLRDLASDAPTTPAMIVTSDNGVSVAGQNNYLNDLLNIAGGENVIKASGYVTIDREKLLTLRPQVIVLLLPGASDAVKRQAISAFDDAGILPAVRDKRFLVIDAPDALIPGSRAPALAAAMAQALRPTPTPARP
ncbi:MAG TPA: ABC transporter substrate-binding protein, partial [Tepidisphaeraceae bacterium]